MLNICSLRKHMFFTISFSRRVSSFWFFLRYNRVVEGLRCVPSSTNEQPGNLTNQKSPFPTDQPIISQEKEPIRKHDTKRNNQSTTETHTSFDISRKSKSKDQTKALNIPVKVSLGGGRYAELTEWNCSKRVDLRFWKTDTIPTKAGVSLAISQWKVLYSAMQVVDDFIS